MKTAGLVLDMLHVYAYLFSGLFPVAFPPFLSFRVNLSSCLILCPL